VRVHEGTFTNSHDHHCHTLGLPFRTAETDPTNRSNAVTVYENLARDRTITDPTVILRLRDREFGYRPEGIDRWIWDRVELEGGKKGWG
jgi:hypothetical protein